MTLRQAIFAALRGDAELLPSLTESLRLRIQGKDETAMTTVVQAAEALEPILAEAVQRKPSRLGKFGWKSAHLLAGLAAEDEFASGRLAAVARNQTVGIVFVDVAGFTTFTAKHGDDEAIALLQKLNALTARVVKSCKGEVVKSLGDGYLLAFPSASQAVRGALGLHESAVATRASDPAFQIALRIAVHAGEPLIEGDDMLGHDVNLTARLLDHCNPDAVVVSLAAKEQAERRLQRVAFNKRREVKIRGLATRTTVFTAVRLDEVPATGKRAGAALSGRGTRKR
jgi:class 3 adenylate cyclase